MKTVRQLPTWVMDNLQINAALRKVLVRQGRFVLVFHGVASERHPHIKSKAHPHHTVAELRQTLAWLKDRFAFLTLDEFLHRDLPGVLLTFDDGQANNFELALPVLEEFSAPAVFFISTQHVIEPTNWLNFNVQRATEEWGGVDKVPSHLRHEFFNGISAESLAQHAQHPLVIIGGHTISHPFMTQIGDEQLEHELVEGRRYLQELTGQPINTFAYPTNDYDKRSAIATKAAGYRYAFAVDSQQVGMPNYEIERIGLYDASSPYLSAKLSGMYRKPIFGRISA